MNQGKYVFSQLMSFVSHNDFLACVNRYQGDYKVKDFSCWKQFLCMAFGQLTHRESLSDTVMCLAKLEGRLYHLGIGKAISKSTLSKANENRDWRIYQDLAQILIAEARRVYGGDSELEVDLQNNVFAIDATVIDLCLSVFPWAQFRKTKSAVRLTTQLNLKNAIPEFIAITSASIHEINQLDEIRYEADSFYVMDRGFFDLERLYRIHLTKAFFVIRARKDLKYNFVKSFPCEKQKGIVSDQAIKMKNFRVSKDYPEKIRRIRFYDSENDRYFVFLTNNFDVKATDIAQLYKHRWMIELFFKWIKQHLKIKSFWGNSANAVKTQVWIAICVYVIIAIAKKRLNINHSLYEMLQVFSITAFEKTPISELFSLTLLAKLGTENRNQLKIFE